MLTTFISNGYVEPALRRCILQGVTLKMVLGAAFGLNLNKPNELDRGVVGGPRWSDSERYDIEAKAADPAGTTTDQLVLMVQQLVADRFKLKVRRETREADVYELVVARSGIKLKPAPATETKRILGGNPARGESSFQALWLTLVFRSQRRNVRAFLWQCWLRTSWIIGFCR